MDFEEAHALWLERHLTERTGERRGRLERGHLHAEKLFLRNVWWPLRGHLEHLHPEYEITDWRGRSYFADFAWLPGYVTLIIEIKGYASHVRDMDRLKYSNELNRETFLYAMGGNVISFAYDDVEQHPEVCITLLRMALSRYQPERIPSARAVFAEKELIRYAIRVGGQLRPKDVEIHFGIDHRTAVLMLRKLCDKGWLLPAKRGTGQRIVRYELAHGVLDYFN
ncbi:hypothetical protein V3851_12830 [Paenibacillus sp. M1]|uniref:AbiEi antitoxin N-terminal domain-containing protein n=1 Tax=Paenibacillus haidiansis TaxID=1574488 RepID=A0ABU7VTK6_9BACL